MSSVRFASLAAAAVAAAALAGACTDPLAARPDVALTPRFDAGVGVKPPAEQTKNQYVVIYKKGVTGLARPASAGAAVQRGRLVYANGAVYDNVTDPAALATDPNVAGVHENFFSYTTDVAATAFPTSATFYRRGWQWNMKQIRADSVPGTVTGAGTKVCIIDTGIDKTHQDLVGKVVAEQSFVDVAHGYPGPGLSAAALDSNGHGTHVASTVTSNGIGVGAVAPGAHLITAKVFAATGGASLAAIFDAITYCQQSGADAINMSLGGTRNRPLTAAQVQDSLAYVQVIQAARQAGTTVVVSAGNNGADLDASNPNLSYTWPAQIPGTVTVGATAPYSTAYPFPAGSLPGANFDSLAYYSNYGPDVNVYAPGGAGFINAIQSSVTAACSSIRVGGTCAGGRQYLSINGTSMASPHVAGIAALITGRSTRARGLARTQAVENCIYSTGDATTYTVGSVTNTKPRINARKAATAACAGL